MYVFYQSPAVTHRFLIISWHDFIILDFIIIFAMKFAHILIYIQSKYI